MERLKNFLKDVFFWRSPEKLLRRPLFIIIFFGDHQEKNFWRPFFGRALALVSLALSIPVLGLESVCPRKGCLWPRIFLCPWPWPRALCPWLHLRSLVAWYNPVKCTIFHGGLKIQKLICCIVFMRFALKIAIYKCHGLQYQELFQDHVKLQH